MPIETHQDSALTLELRDEDGAVYVMWSGKSTAREPSKFILGILTKAIEISTRHDKPLILDFQNIGYMNSSTITPIIRVLDRAMRGSSSVRVLYRSDLKWQQLSFTALEVFQTPDRRIEICGV
jgi:hypothetical protein